MLVGKRKIRVFSGALCTLYAQYALYKVSEPLIETLDITKNGLFKRKKKTDFLFWTRSLIKKVENFDLTERRSSVCFSCRARGRGGMNFGLGPFSSCSLKSGGDYDAERNNNSRNGGKGVSSLRHGGGWSGIGGLYHKMTVANSKTGHSVHMRGLPFKATMDDVSQFFAPLIPVDIRLLYESNTGRPNGKCDVDFPTHSDAETAMRKDKQNMGKTRQLNFRL